MVAIVAGNSLGLIKSSAQKSGQQSIIGNPQMGRDKESVYLNAASALAGSDGDHFIAAAPANSLDVITYNMWGNLTVNGGPLQAAGNSDAGSLEQAVLVAAQADLPSMDFPGDLQDSVVFNTLSVQLADSSDGVADGVADTGFTIVANDMQYAPMMSAMFFQSASSVDLSGLIQAVASAQSGLDNATLSLNAAVQNQADAEANYIDDCDLGRNDNELDWDMQAINDAVQSVQMAQNDVDQAQSDLDAAQSALDAAQTDPGPTDPDPGPGPIDPGPGPIDPGTGPTDPGTGSTGADGSPPESNADILTRMYREILGREPDPEGYNWWLAQMNTGTSAEDVKAAFLKDQDKDTHNATILRDLYKSILGRDTPDEAGFNWWLAQMDAGTPEADVRAEFERVKLAGTGGTVPTTHQQHKDYVTATLTQVLHYIPQPSMVAYYTQHMDDGASEAAILAEITASPEAIISTDLANIVNTPKLHDLYNAVVHRDPTAAELASGLSAMNAGTSIGSIGTALRATPEGQRYQHINDVTGLYVDILGRIPDANELNDWVNAMDTGTSIASVATALALEAQALSDAMDDFLSDVMAAMDNDMDLNAQMNVLLGTLQDQTNDEATAQQNVQDAQVDYDAAVIEWNAALVQEKEFRQAFWEDPLEYQGNWEDHVQSMERDAAYILDAPGKELDRTKTALDGAKTALETVRGGDTPTQAYDADGNPIETIVISGKRKQKFGAIVTLLGGADVNMLVNAFTSSPDKAVLGLTRREPTAAQKETERQKYWDHKFLTDFTGSAAIGAGKVTAVRVGNTVTLTVRATVSGYKATESIADVKAKWDGLSYTENGITYKTDVQLTEVTEKGDIEIRASNYSDGSSHGNINGTVDLNFDKTKNGLPPGLAAHEFGHALFGVRDAYALMQVPGYNTRFRGSYPGFEDSIMADITGIVRRPDLKELILAIEGHLY